MQGYDSQDTRFEVTDSRYENGRLLVDIKGMAGETFTDVPVEEAHGFHSRPADGAIGFLSSPGGRRDQATFRLGHDVTKVPQIEKGEAVLYDAADNFVKVTGNGLVISHANIVINGDIQLNGSLNATGSVMDSTGNSNHHTH